MLSTLLSLILLSGTGFYPAPADTSEADDPAVRVREAAEHLLQQRFPDDAYRLRVRVIRTSRDLENAPSLNLEFPSEGALPHAHTQVRVYEDRALTGGNKIGWALLYVAHFDSVMVARRRMRADEPVTASDVSAVWLETTTFSGEPMRATDFRDMTTSGAVFATRLLRADNALRRSDLRPPYAAETGEAVTMTYQRNGLLLHLPCKAREPGFAGETIRLYSTDTDATYRARLTDAGKATWIETL